MSIVELAVEVVFIGMVWFIMVWFIEVMESAAEAKATRERRRTRRGKIDARLVAIVEESSRGREREREREGGK